MKYWAHKNVIFSIFILSIYRFSLTFCHQLPVILHYLYLNVFVLAFARHYCWLTTSVRNRFSLSTRHKQRAPRLSIPLPSRFNISIFVFVCNIHKDDSKSINLVYTYSLQTKKIFTYMHLSYEIFLKAKISFGKPFLDKLVYS